MSRWRKAEVATVSLLASGTGVLGVSRWLRHRRSDYRVFILEYHDVSDGAESEGIVSAERLRRHIRVLKNRYPFDTVSSAAEVLGRPGDLTEDRVVLTFDDGLSGNYRWAWPVLRDERVPATFFLTTGFLDGSDLWFDVARRGLEAATRAGADLPAKVREVLLEALGEWPLARRGGSGVERLKQASRDQRQRVVDCLQESELDLAPAAAPVTWDQVREMHGSGVEMGCHTVTHPILSKLSRAEQEVEILGSRERLAEELGEPPRSFAMPNGTRRDFDEATLEILADGGFRAACSTVRGSNRPGCDLLSLRRVGVGSDSNRVINARLSSLFDQEVRDRLSAVGA